MFCRLNKGIPYCASPPTCQVLLLEVPFILLIYEKKVSSFWFSSPQTPPHYFHASPPTWQVLLLQVPFILLIYKKKASSFWFSSPQPPPHYFHASPPTWQVLLLEVPFILLIWKEIVFLWKENYKSAKCNIAFELKRLLVNQRRIHLLTKAENGRNSRPEWLIPRCISTSYHTMVSPKNLSQITALNHEWVMGSWLLIINLNSPPCREVHLTETRP